jgi:hypothetical protein
MGTPVRLIKWISLTVIICSASYITIAVALQSNSLQTSPVESFYTSTIPVIKIEETSTWNATARFVDAETVDISSAKALAARVVGRVVPVPTDNHSLPKLRHQWPAIYLEARFSGDTLFIPFDDDMNRYRVTLDGDDQGSILVSKPSKGVLVIEGLGAGEHVVRLDKLSESLSGSRDFLGFYIPGSASPLDPPLGKDLQMEFIGDSDTVGYGNMSSRRDCASDEVVYRTDTTMAFGPILARRFDADYQIIASSGIGLIRSLDGAEPDATMAVRYERDLFDVASRGEEPTWTPEIIVLAVGPNDFENAIEASEPWSDTLELEMAFETRLSDFLHDISTDAPDAVFVLLEMQDYDRGYLEAYRRVAEQIKSKGNLRVLSVEISKMQKTGCHWHPSLEDHQMIAARIEQALMSVSGSAWASETFQ